MDAIILSAGLGTRLLPHTKKVPKAGFPFLNIPLFQYAVQNCQKEDIQSFIFNTHYLEKEFCSIVKNFLPENSYKLSSEQPEILGSGGGIKKASRFLSQEQDFLVFNADSLILSKKDFIKPMIDQHRQQKNFCTMLCQPAHLPVYESVHSEDAVNVLHIGKMEHNGDRGKRKKYHFLGVMVLSRECLDWIQKKKAHIFSDVLNPAIREKKKIQLHIQEELRWFETGQEAEFLNASRECLALLSQAYVDDYKLEQVFRAQNFSRSKHKARLLEDTQHLHGQFLQKVLKKSLKKRQKGFELNSNLNPLSGEAQNSHIGLFKSEKSIILTRSDIPKNICFEGFVIVGENIIWPSSSILIKDSVILNNADLSQLSGDTSFKIFS